MPKTSAVTFSRGIYKIPYLADLLGVDSVVKCSRFFSTKTTLSTPTPTPTPTPNAATFVVGWGLKSNTQIARQYAESHQLSYLTLEDGLLRSVDLGISGSPPLSLVIDDIGVYYDATRPSRLERILANDPAAIATTNIDQIPPFKQLCSALAGTDSQADPLNDAALIARARQCIQRIVDNRLSKYNVSPDITLETSGKPRVLVVDQTAGDLSIPHGLASADSFTQMLTAALSEHPDAEVLVKIHPDVIAGKKHSHLAQTTSHPRVRLLTENCSPISLIQQVSHVYVVTSQLGFEALMVGKPVTCFGAPFYAGWGLTDDRIAIPRRVRDGAPERSVEQVFAAAYLLYSHYRDPHSGAPCEIETVIEHLALQRHYHRENSGTLFCYGFTLWKRAYIRSYLKSPWNSLRFVRSAAQISHHLPQKDARIVVWGTREDDGIQALAEKGNIPIWRMEDGFLRSVGLGSDLTAPASLVLDKRGIYFDPAHVSDLEAILEKSTFSAAQIARAGRLREALIDAKISKYNVGKQRPLTHSAAPGQRVILVPGQVEGDASIRLGCQDIRTNSALLQAVRKSAPDAYIIYKPHPDVLSGNRKGAKKIETSLNCDQLVTDIGIAQCLDAVDEVHTMTSLVGFEGLLRGKKVATYGLPFYAGWGLTDDKQTSSRRQRTLTRDELITGCMVIYPRYMHGQSNAFTSPEQAITVLKQQRSTATTETHIFAPATSRLAMKFVNLVRGLMHGK